MGNQGRSEMDMRSERGNRLGSDRSGGTVRTSGNGREEFYTRAESRTAGGSFGREDDSARGYDAGAREGTGGSYGSERETYRSAGYGRSDDRGPHHAYGDYGHPYEDNRFAYGDMGSGRHGVAHVAPQYDEVEDRRPVAGLWRRFRRWGQSARRAREVMTRNPHAARPTDSVQQIAQMMIDEDTGIIPIVEENQRLVGVVTDRDIVCRLTARGVDVRAAKASDVMTDEVECVTEQHSLHDVLRLMAEHQIRRVPVVARGDRLVGIISMADIVREADVDEDLQDTFEEISSERGFWSRLR